MAKYSVDCEVHWGSKYEVEADSYEEAESKGRELFLKDYELENHPMVYVLGMNIDVEKESLNG